jgi:hypothetical protein
MKLNTSKVLKIGLTIFTSYYLYKLYKDKISDARSLFIISIIILYSIIFKKPLISDINRGL